MGFDTTWRTKAACKGQSIVLFYGFGEDEQQNERLERETKAKALCSSCLVQEQCLAEALNNREEGVWGGMSKYERKRLLRNHRQVRPKDTLVLFKKLVTPKKLTGMQTVIDSRSAWDGEEVLIKREDFTEIEYDTKWTVEKNGKVLYETFDETDAWLMFGSWTITF